MKWVFLAVTIIVIAIVLVRRAPKETAPLPEVLASELSLREGRLYQTNQTQPFTGYVIDRYAEGTLKSRSKVEAGMLNGVSEGWHTNGVVQVREHFTNGVSHGLREKWYPSGTNLSAGEIVAGKHNGTFRRFHENGTLAEEVTMKNGEPDGLSSAFYPSGFLKAQVTVKGGKSTDQKSWKDGAMTLPGYPTNSAAISTNR